MDAAEREAWRIEAFGGSYRAWLMDIAGVDESDFGILFDLLHSIEYTWSKDIPRDADRAAAGQDLRLEFEYERGIACDDEWVDWPCSFLEMLLGLAKAMETHILYDWNAGDRTYRWFWMMLENIGLDFCTNDWFENTGGSGQMYVEDRVDFVLNRRYDDHGNGGLFPLWDPPEDQRNAEIWYQASAYILENDLE